MNQCQYLSGGFCLKAAKPIQINQVFCDKCFASGTKLIDPLLFRINGTHINNHQPLVGTELKKLISWFPIPKGRCTRCRSLEIKYNRWGIDKCKAKKDRIIKRLEIAAKRLHIATSRHLLSILVDKAINNANRSSTNNGPT